MKNLEKAVPKKNPSPHMRWTVRPLPLVMPEEAWRLVTMYLAVLQHKLTREGKPRVNLPRLIGGIVAWYVFARQKWIRRKFYEVEAQQLRSDALPGSYRPDQLTRIRTAETTDLPTAARLDGGLDPSDIKP